MEYQEFLNKLQKRGSKPHKITHCLGARDAWKWLRKNKWHRTDGKSVSQSLYSSIINSVNKVLIDQMLEGHEIELPMRMGSFYLASIPTKVMFKEGKLINNYRTDWIKTLNLWYKDKDAYTSHKTVKRIQNEIVCICWDKHKAIFNNKQFYMFRANRSLVKKVGKAFEQQVLPVRKLI